MPQLMAQAIQPATPHDARRHSIQIRSDTWQLCVPMWFLVHFALTNIQSVPVQRSEDLSHQCVMKLGAALRQYRPWNTWEKPRKFRGRWHWSWRGSCYCQTPATVGSRRCKPGHVVQRKSWAHHVHLLTPRVQIIWIALLSLVTGWLLTTEDLVRSEANQCGLRWWTKRHWASIFPQYFSFPCPHHSTHAPHSFI